jgi:hypothetical protein
VEGGGEIGGGGGGIFLGVSGFTRIPLATCRGLSAAATGLDRARYVTEFM